jgi:cell surface hyaluronidase
MKRGKPMDMTKRILLALVFFASPAAAATNWSESGLPTSGSVAIPAGQSIILDQSLNLTDLTISGELVCADKDLALSAQWIMVHGQLACGTSAAPFSNKFTITLTGANQTANIMEMGTKFLGVMGGGAVELHGEQRKGWTRLAKTAARGARSITLNETLPWRVSDKIVLVSTDFHFDHAEERTISAINDRIVTLDAVLKYEHYCGTSTFGTKSITECGEVGLSTRNIVIRGDASSTSTSFGGHMMVMKNSSARIDGVEFLNMGQKGKIARYPFHWHLTGDAAGQYITNSSIIHSFNRFLSIHGTSNTRVAGNFAYDTIGHGYYMEDGIETGNVIEDNLGAVVRNASNGLPTLSDKDASVFWISNPDNTIRRNVSAGSENTGFWLGFPDHPIGLSATNAIWPRRTPLKDFSNNISHSNGGRGLFVDGAEDKNRRTQVTWFEPLVNPADENSAKVSPKFINFTAYKNRFEGVWMRGFSYPVLQSPRLADNLMGAYFASLGTHTGYIQDGLVVGETANKGNPDSWETKGVDGREVPTPWEANHSIRGLEFYDGPMFIRRTTFANFRSNTLRKSGALTSLSPNPFWISSRNASSEITFANANKVWLDPLKNRNDGDAFSVFRDVDGSVTGIKGRMIVAPNGLLLTASCTRMAGWNAYVCPHSYVGVQIQTAANEDLTGSLLTRDDGKSRKLGSPEQYPGSLHVNLLSGRTHHLQLSRTTPKKIEFVRNEQAGKAVRLSLDYPTANFTFKLWGSEPVPKATSLAALGTGDTKYYYDAASKRLHLRLVSGDGGWKGYELVRP